MDRFERIARRLGAASAADYQELLDEVRKGNAVLTAQDVHRDIPTIHTFAGKYHDSVDHLGFGMFKGSTEHGEFTFDAGGAMSHAGDVSWTTLSAVPAVLRDLRYDVRKVERALEELRAASWGSRAAAGFDDVFTVMKPIRFKPEGGTMYSLMNARMILEAGYKLEDGWLRYDTNHADYETTAFFRRGAEHAQHVFRGFSIGYGGEGPRGMEEFLKMFGFGFSEANVFGRALVEASDPGSVRLSQL